MACTYSTLFSTFMATRTASRWPVIQPFTHAFIHQCVAAALHGASRPNSGLCVLPKATTGFCDRLYQPLLKYILDHTEPLPFSLLTFCSMLRIMLVKTHEWILKQTGLKHIIARMKPRRVFHHSGLPALSAARPGLMLHWVMCTSPLLQMLSAWGPGKWVVTNRAQHGGGTGSMFRSRCYHPLCVLSLGL